MPDAQRGMPTGRIGIDARRLNRQRGRLLELPALGAILVVIGAWIGGKHHPAGFLLALLPVGVWLWLHLGAWWTRRRLARERGRSARERLSVLRDTGFDPQLLLDGHLGWGQSWVAFDFQRGEAVALEEYGERIFPVGALSLIRLGRSSQLGGGVLNHTLNLYFGPPDPPDDPQRSVTVIDRSRGRVEDWARALTERTGVPVSAA